MHSAENEVDAPFDISIKISQSRQSIKSLMKQDKSEQNIK